MMPFISECRQPSGSFSGSLPSQPHRPFCSQGRCHPYHREGALGIINLIEFICLCHGDVSPPQNTPSSYIQRWVLRIHSRYHIWSYHTTRYTECHTFVHLSCVSLSQSRMAGLLFTNWHSRRGRLTEMAKFLFLFCLSFLRWGLQCKLNFTRWLRIALDTDHPATTSQLLR